LREILIYSFNGLADQTNQQLKVRNDYIQRYHIHESVHDQWMIWMQHKHIPEILATGKFILPPDD
jgi:hypothetical protein